MKTILRTKVLKNKECFTCKGEIFKGDEYIVEVNRSGKWYHHEECAYMIGGI